MALALARIALFAVQIGNRCKPPASKRQFMQADAVADRRRRCGEARQGAYVPSGRCSQPDAAELPPSTWTVVPVRNRDSGLAKNNAAPAKSSAVPKPNGTFFSYENCSPRETSSCIASSPGVGIASGAKVFTRIPSGANSNANVLDRFSTAAFMAAYIPNPGAARNASTDVTLMIDPPPRIIGTNARIISVTLVKFS